MKRPFQGNIRYFQNCDTPIKAYFLGFIAADGCLLSNGKNSISLSITLSEVDRNLLNKLKEEIGCEHRIYNIRGKMTHNKDKEKYHCRFQLCNKLLISDLMSYGFTERKSITMPNILQNIPKEFRDSFILGYFDGDGSISYNIASKQHVISFRGTEEFLQSFVETLQFEKYRLIKDKQKNCFTLTAWRKSDIQKFKQIYNNKEFYLTRKFIKFP
ncbi:MAG: LAGLIDADG family homing endonuclease [Alphaproteobacteria bacterium]